MRRILRFVLISLSFCGTAFAQSHDSLRDDLAALTNIIAVSGYESAETQYILQQLAGANAQQDAMGNITVTFGNGTPRRLLVAPVDEPGLVVSKVEHDGYLRVQRLPQTGLPPHWNELQNAQPMRVSTRDGKLLSAVSAGLSIHLQPGRTAPPDPDDLDNFYVDLGAKNADEVARSGVEVLSPLAADRHLLPIGMSGLAGTSVGDKFGAAILLQLARAMKSKSPQGTVTLAFVVQQWAGSRGLTRIMQQLHPDELIYIGRPRPAGGTSMTGTTAQPSEHPALGSGILAFDLLNADPDRGWESEFLQHKAPSLRHMAAAPFLVRGYGPPAELPAHNLHLGIPLMWPLTAGETLDERDLQQLMTVLAGYVGVTAPVSTMQPVLPAAYAPLPPRPTITPHLDLLLQALTEAYGVSGDEKMSREAVAQMLPPWAHPTTDTSGNLILHIGSSQGTGTVFMAHTDELGFRVRAVLPNGSLDLENKGGGTPAFYWGHPAVVHSGGGMRSAVVELPEGWDTAKFHFPADFRAPAILYVGASTAEDVAQLGIKVGDTVTISKRFTHLLDDRVSIRSLDDRVGCAAMIKAVWTLGPASTKNTTFVWSTREELGLEGAGEWAASAAKAGTIPKTVFAIDTFVSSDSPIESNRFADATIGDGFVVRAIDNSNITPLPLVQRVRSIAQKNRIPAQYGITGGGNDGAQFLRYGATDVPLSWPLRYSHSPAELIDMRDLESLAAVTAALAREW